MIQDHFQIEWRILFQEVNIETTPDQNLDLEVDPEVDLGIVLDVVRNILITVLNYPMIFIKHLQNVVLNKENEDLGVQSGRLDQMVP